MAIITINGVDMPSPSELSISYKSIGKSDISAAGSAIMDRIALKRELSVSWAYLDPEHAAVLLGAINGDLFMSVAYADPASGAGYTGSFRADGLSVGVARYSGSTPDGYKEIKVKLSEK